MAASRSLLKRSPLSAVLLACIILAGLGQVGKGLKCYCEGRHCKGAEANGTCVEERGGVCFGALAKVYGTDPGNWEYEFFYGCYSGRPKRLALCQNNMIPGMKCCKDRDYCNWAIVPKLSVGSTTPRPEGDVIYRIHPASVIVPVSVLVIGACSASLYCYLKKRKRESVGTDKDSDSVFEPPVVMSQLTEGNAG